MESLGRRLKRLRESSNLSQIRAAQIFGVSNVQISRYESDTHKPDPELLAKFADYYEVSTDYLLGRTDDPSEKGMSIGEYNEALSEMFADDPESGLFWHEFKNASPEERRKVIEVWRIINEKEKNRKPGQKQGE